MTFVSARLSILTPAVAGPLLIGRLVTEVRVVTVKPARKRNKSTAV
jgi:hypothetical protein